MRDCRILALSPQARIGNLPLPGLCSVHTIADVKERSRLACRNEACEEHLTGVSASG